jgi:hypothetical protein
MTVIILRSAGYSIASPMRASTLATTPWEIARAEGALADLGQPLEADSLAAAQVGVWTEQVPRGKSAGALAVARALQQGHAQKPVDPRQQRRHQMGDIAAWRIDLSLKAWRT